MEDGITSGDPTVEAERRLFVDGEIVGRNLEEGFACSSDGLSVLSFEDLKVDL